MNNWYTHMHLCEFYGEINTVPFFKLVIIETKGLITPDGEYFLC